MSNTKLEVYRIEGLVKDIYPNSDDFAALVQLLQVYSDLQYEGLLLCKKDCIILSERDQQRFTLNNTKRVCSILYEFIALLKDLHPCFASEGTKLRGFQKTFHKIHSDVENSSQNFVDVSKRLTDLIKTNPSLVESIKDIRDSSAHYFTDRGNIKEFLGNSENEKTQVEDIRTNLSTYFKVVDDFWANHIVEILEKNLIKGANTQDTLLPLAKFLAELHNVSMEYISRLMTGFLKRRVNVDSIKKSKRIVDSSDKHISAFLKHSIEYGSDTLINT